MDCNLPLTSFAAFPCVILLILVLAGCTPEVQQNSTRKPPRPVSVFTLASVCPDVTSEVTGTVVSWKTERIGFEVKGRVRQVIEPNEEIEGRIDAGGDGMHLISPGTPLARLDDQRFRIAVQSAEAAVEITRRQIDAARVDIEQRLPAVIAAAEAEWQLAKVELERHRKLVEKSAGTRSQLDQAETTMATTLASVARAKAELAARQAELKSLEAQELQAEQQLADARRDLEDSVLYSSFRGQVAATHVLPGSYVAPGDPVVTVQLMDPVLIEFELSAEASRRFQHGDSLRVTTVDRNSQLHELSCLVYLIDATADPDTRTFTVKLLSRNTRVQLTPPPELKDHPIARTLDLRPVNIGPILIGDNRLFVEQESIHHDALGAFVWKAANRRLGEVASGIDHVLNVEKIRVEADSIRVPFLGNWNFVPVQVRSDQNFDPDHDLITGRLVVEDGDADQWNGDKVLFDRGGWLLRPGELVRVELSAPSPAKGFYVPMKAVRHESGCDYVFTIDTSSADRTVARRVPVKINQADAVLRPQESLQHIEPMETGLLTEGTELVEQGVHYLSDGDEVLVIGQAKGAL